MTHSLFKVGLIVSLNSFGVRLDKNIGKIRETISVSRPKPRHWKIRPRLKSRSKLGKLDQDLDQNLKKFDI